MKEVLSYILAIAIALVGMVILAIWLYLIFIGGVLFIAAQAFMALMSSDGKSNSHGASSRRRIRQRRRSATQARHNQKAVAFD